MAINKEELKKKAFEAASAEELMELVKAAGVEITAEEAAKLFAKAQEQLTDTELSLEELDAVSGGWDRDWLTDGCAATVGPNSTCWSDDACWKWEVVYTHEPYEYPCRNCGRENAMYQASDTGYTDGLSCRYCHCSDNKQFLKDWWEEHPHAYGH